MVKSNRRIKKSSGTKRQWLSFKRFIRFLSVSMAVGCALSLLGVVGFYGVKATQVFLDKPISEIVINSDFKYVTKYQITQRVNSMIGKSFVAQNIHEIQADIESVDWIDSVNLSRKWPNILVVNLVEQIPIARWSDQGFVNVRGELVLSENLGEIAHLTELNADNDNETVSVMEQYSTLAAALRQYEMNIVTLQKSARGAWQMDLDNQWVVKLGQGDLLKKIGRLTLLFDQQILTKHSAIESVDMRYPSGLAIKWIEQDDKEKSELRNTLGFSMKLPENDLISERVINKSFISKHVMHINRNAVALEIKG